MEARAQTRRRAAIAIAVAASVLVPAKVASAAQYEDHWSYRNTIAYVLYDEGTETTYRGAFGVGADIVLSNRDSDWAQQSHTVLGPNLRAQHKYNCVDYNGVLLPNTSCSSGWRTHTATSYAYNFLTSFGTYHADNTLYWYDSHWSFEHPEFPGAWSIQYPPFNYNLTSEKFECKPGISPVCHFLEPDSPASEIWQ